ncbi:epoxide hydrolase 1-like isoform X1 [Lytechinus pictus]|uniref:epoxide hydrolase 1-like isoform X1 n=1 Tax=Lytechinus pictus TaxID=7653 RepID=UPI0030BA107F
MYVGSSLACPRLWYILPHYIAIAWTFYSNRVVWRDAEKQLNQFDQFLTNIEGIDVHFIHAKPKLKPGQKAKPIIIIHGWPGSVYEFHKIIPMLTDPTSHGGSSDDVFEVICPSIPGFGFSEAPHRKGFSVDNVARVMNKLMQRLGFKSYYAQGGDMGTAITVNMAIMFPDNVKGLHNNDLAQVSGKSFLYPMLANLWPSFFLPKEEERNALLGIGERIKFIITEMGYMYDFGTKPDSLAMALNDSPMGLASVILEKFSIWTNRNWRNFKDGGLTQAYSMDDLLTNVMIYWVNGNIASSVRLFKEEFGENAKGYHFEYSSRVPFGYACFPYEFMATSDWLMKIFHPRILHFTYFNDGGHFPAFQVPSLLAQDIREFVRKVEAL